MKPIGRFVRREWGWYLVLLNRKHFKAKILYFNAGGACSMQFHKHRSELWLFLKGIGRLNGRHIRSGQWAHILSGHVHQYVAKRKTYVIEVQYGEKCEECDIVRV